MNNRLTDDSLPDGNAAGGQTTFVRVALDVPLPGLFDYRATKPAPPGIRAVAA